jgi:Mg-chelatase subunit ChlD
MPATVRLGEQTQVTMTLSADCPMVPYPLHVPFVLDRSGSMAGNKLAEMKTAAREAITGLQLDRNPAFKVAVISFAEQANTDTGLTNSSGRAISAIARLRASGGKAIDSGIDRARQVLALAARHPNLDDLTITDVMVVFSDGRNDRGRGPVQAAAARAKARGILVIAVCVGHNCDTTTMRRLASGPRYYFEARRSSQLAGAIRQIIRGIIDLHLRRLTITDVLPGSINYVEDSAWPESRARTAVR